jgi:GTPase SAR1 family protein
MAPAREVGELVDLARRAATAYQRPDLAARVDDLASRLEAPEVRVVVAGDFKQGKSSLVNGLLRYGVCPVDDDLATSVPTACSYAPATTVTVVRRDAAGCFEREIVPFAALRAVAAAGPVPGERSIVGVEVGVPSPRLDGGLVLIDCPGDGGLTSLNRVTTLGLLASASALLFVSDATAELDATELGFLTVAAKVCPRVLVVLTKCDLVPAWREVERHCRNRLDDAGLRDVATVAVSAYLWAHAAASGDATLAELSGFAGLDGWLDSAVLSHSEQLTVRSVLLELLLVVDQLDQQFSAEETALADPAEAARLQADLEDTATRLRALKEQASRWQAVLNDGIGDLTSDIDHDLSDRLRRLTREADETLDEVDPAEVWDHFEPWLYSCVADHVSDNLAELRRRTAALTETVAELFQADVDAVLSHLAVTEPGAVLAAVTADASVDLRTMTVSQRAFTALRGSYGGILMGGFMGAKAGAIAAAAGVALTSGFGLLVVPVASSLFALALGNKAVKDEMERQLMVRRHNAKAAHRRYTEEARFVVAKHTRDQIRLVQRTLRDHFLGRAEEFERTAKAALEQSRSASAGAEEQRAGRLADVRSELTRIRVLASRIAAALDPAAEVGR